MDIKTNKIINAILFFAEKENDNSINRLKLMKLLWLSDRLHLNKFGRKILKDSYHALPHGPVPSQTMRYTGNSVPEIFDASRYHVQALRPSDLKYFSKSDLDVMEEVWKQFGKHDIFQLRDISHKFPEWLRFEKDLSTPNAPRSYPMIEEDFFSIPDIEEYKAFLPIENIADSLAQFRSHNAIQSNLSQQCL